MAFSVVLGIFTKSQNHRMVGVGRDLCGSSSQPPLLKKGKTILYQFKMTSVLFYALRSP